MCARRVVEVKIAEFAFAVAQDPKLALECVCERRTTRHTATLDMQRLVLQRSLALSLDPLDRAVDVVAMHIDARTQHARAFE